MKTVLIADDVSFVRKALRGLLEARGYRVVGEAASGTEAIELYRVLQPTFVTMDLVMPGMNGVQATKTLLSEYPEARVIVVSSMGQEELIADAIRAGAREYVSKPFRETELHSAIEFALSDETRKVPSEGPLQAC